MEDVLSTVHKAYRRVNEGGGSGPHPNVLPVIEVSKTLFPLCIMTPWMPNGNIVDYITENWGADRLLLVREHRHEGRWGCFANYIHNSLRKRAAASCTFTGWVLYMAI